MTTSAREPRGAVGVDELKRAWQSVQDGQFRQTASSRSAVLEAPRPAAGKATSSVRWSPIEAVLPVIGCAGSAGASTLALAIATAAGAARVIECCTVTASGLAAASTAELGRHESGWVQGSRDAVLIERTSQILVGVHEVPLPSTPTKPLTLTVLDVGWELGQVLATPSWLADQLTCAAHVVAVTTATVPGLRRLEGALALLEHTHTVVAVLGQRRRRWPSAVEHSLGALTRSLDRDGRLVEILQDRDLAVRGLDSKPLPPPLLSAADQVLRLAGFQKGYSS